MEAKSVSASSEEIAAAGDSIRAAKTIDTRKAEILALAKNGKALLADLNEYIVLLANSP